MTSWKRAVGYGVLVWLVPFAVAFAIFPIHGTMRPLFESIMAVAVTTAAVVFGLQYLRRAPGASVGETVRLGVLWLAISIAIDAPLMLLGGPMQMTLGEYMADIGVTYLLIPVVTWGLGVAGTRSRTER